MRKRANQKASPGRTILLLFLIIIIFFSTSTVLTAYPQKLLINNYTKIGTAQFLGDNKLLLNGNMVQFGAGDTIVLNGRSFIRLNGKQAQLGGSTYQEGIRTIVADIFQNVLFSQEVGFFNESNVAQIVVESTVINLIPVSQAPQEVININVQDLSGGQPKLIDNYNVQFTQSTTYTNDNGIMLKLTKKEQRVYVSLIGIRPYRNIIFRTG